MTEKLVLDDGVQVELVRVTPDLAKEWLGRNPRNRAVNQRVVNRYVRAFLAGSWTFVGDPIRLDKSGDVLDGQHRLLAVAESGESVPFLVVSGLPSRSQEFMDLGRPRGAFSQLQIENVPNSKMVAATARLLLMWLNGNLLANNMMYSNTEILDFSRQNLEELSESVRMGLRVHGLLRGSAAAYGACFYRFNMMDADASSEFSDMLATGARLEKNHPALVFRDMILRRKMADRRGVTTSETIFYLTKSWNNFRTDKWVSKLQLPKAGLSRMSDIPVPL